MADNNVLDQNEIERLLGGLGGGAAPPPAEPAPAINSGILSQEELNALFGASATPPAPHQMAPIPPPPVAPVPPPPSPQVAAPAPFATSGWDTPVDSFDSIVGDDVEGIPRGDLDYIAKRADESLRSIAAMPVSLPTEVIEFQFPEFGGTVPSTEHATLDQISEVDLDVKVELGRTYMYIEDVLRLRRGSVVPLDKMAGETVDIYINGRLLARGEVLVMNENFCVRIAELLAGAIPME